MEATVAVTVTVCAAGQFAPPALPLAAAWLLTAGTEPPAAADADALITVTYLVEV